MIKLFKKKMRLFNNYKIKLNEIIIMSMIMRVENPHHIPLV
jgi:hypothetical protein